jgi:hypothetical protein
VALSQSAPRALLAALAVVSVSLKVVAASSLPPPPASEASGAVTDLLKRGGFTIAADVEDVDFLTIFAHARHCDLRLAIVSPHGWHRNLVQRLAAPNEKVSFIFDGAIFDQQPVWRTWLSFYVSRARHFLGFRAATKPVLAVLATPTCPIESLPWSEVATLD